MAREIMFRAWDSNSKIETFLRVDSIQDAIERGYQIMQFTGMCDEHGDKIWEGDIVNFNPLDTDKFKAEIIYKDGAFRDSLYHHPIKEYKFLCKIGDVYQTPEFLK